MPATSRKRRREIGEGHELLHGAAVLPPLPQRTAGDKWTLPS